MADIVNFLNRNNTSPMFSRLKRSIDDSKQGKASPAQWTSMIKAMTTKGVKTNEIDESGIIAWLESQPVNESILRTDLAKRMDSLMFTIKEVVLQSPKFSRYHQKGGAYKEYLYIANSERDNVVDDLERVEEEMNELVFTPERLCDEPDLVMNLERERAHLIDMKGQSIDFSNHHFSGETTGRHGKNLLAHCRISERPENGLYFIEEIQSDWAQLGRKNDWTTVPRGPLVTNTESWAGMVLRRHLQLAAQNPKVEHISWITETMRNGWTQDLVGEKSKVAQKQAYDLAMKEGMTEAMAAINSDQMTPEALVAAKEMAWTSVKSKVASAGIREPGDMLNDFYLKVIPRIVDKIIAGTGEKVQIKTIEVGAGNMVEVPTIVLTDKVREKLVDKQPVYSRAMLLREPRDSTDSVAALLHNNALTMLGSTKHLHLVSHLYDIATGNRVAGRFVNSVVQVSLAAKEIEEVTDHECFHFAQERMLSQAENRTVLENFAPGTRLNNSVREILLSRGDFVLAKQCMDPIEASAQGFALWNKGVLDVTEAPVKGIFSDIINAVKDVVQWIRKEVLQENYQTVEEVFTAFANGDIAIRDAAIQQDYAKHRVMA